MTNGGGKVWPMTDRTAAQASNPSLKPPAGASRDSLPTRPHQNPPRKTSTMRAQHKGYLAMYTQQQSEALQIVSGMIAGVLMEMDDKTGVGGVKLDLLDQVYLRLQSLKQLCDDTAKETTE